MPFQVKCQNCGFVLQYEVEEIASLDEIARKFDYRCPRCRSALHPEKPRSLEIKVIKGERKGRRAMKVIRYRRLLKGRRRIVMFKRF